jgi:hypothetical protein
MDKNISSLKAILFGMNSGWYLFIFKIKAKRFLKDIPCNNGVN